MADMKKSLETAAAFFRISRGRRTAFLSAALAALAFLLVPALGRRPVFLVDHEFAGFWKRLLDDNPGAPNWKILEFDPARDALPEGSYGFLISADRTGALSAAPGTAENGGSGLPAVYRDLSRTLNDNGALPLAVDPWMVFRRHTTPSLTRERVERFRRDDGVLLLPGGEREAVWAWAAQELQEKPGAFPRDSGVWRERMERLPRDSRFQPGALTYTWEDVGSGLFTSETAWVYAPLSRIQELPGNRTSLLETDRFPEREGWNEYGLQARILWAVPFGNRTNRKAAGIAAEWLRSAEIQSLLAGELKWIPANPSAVPVNPLAFSARKAWAASSYVWEAVSYADD